MDCNEYGRLEGPESAIVEGYLCEVNPKLGTAEIHVYGSDSVPLRFVPSLEQKMLRLETKFVKVRGQGWINDTDEWIAVNVDDVTCPADKPLTSMSFIATLPRKSLTPTKLSGPENLSTWTSSCEIFTKPAGDGSRDL